MRNQLIISEKALAANYSKLKNLASKDCGAVVKANGYGLGARQVAKILEKAGCQNFFVALLEEGIELREEIKNANVFVFHGVMENEAKEFKKYKLIPVLNNNYQLQLWHKDEPCAVHFDTGMTRLGFDEDDVANLQDYNMELIMSHLVSAENNHDAINQTQLEQFKNIAKHFPKSQKSLANSSGVFLGEEFHFDLCRPGIALYGGNPTPALSNPMQQVVKLIAPILQINEINTSKGVGYNSTYIAKKGDVTATIPLGYADGFLRSLSNRGNCYIDGIKLPIVGRVSMDLITILINDLPVSQRRIGQMVEILGESYNICDMARDAGTIEYEIITRLGNRFQKVYA